MKKIFLSLTALTFGASVAFAQTETEVQEPQTEQNIEIQDDQQEVQSDDLQIERLSNEAETSGKKKIEMSELPASVQEAFQNSEFKDWEVAEIYEVRSATNSEGIVEEDVALGNATPEASYEIVAISKDMKDEIADTQEAIQEETEDALEDGEAAEVSTENIKVEIPAVVLKYDQQGQLIEQQEQNGETDLNDQEK